MPTLLLLVLVLAPAAGMVVTAASRPRSTRAAATPSLVAAGVALAAALGLLIAVVSGADPAAGPGTAHWLRADALTVTLATLVTVLGVTVVAYAGRNLEGDPRAPRFFLGAGGVLLGTLTMAAAGRLSLLLVGWVATTVAIVWLIGYRGDAPARAAAARAARALAAGDLALLVAGALVLVHVGDPDLGRLGAALEALGQHDVRVLGAVSLPVTTLVAGLLVVAALARASQLPMPGWLDGTLAAPTPVSALLHAGAVNAGGFLLVRLGALLGAAPTAAVLLAAAAVVTVVASAASMQVRPDVKGGLVASTSAQMGFMLLACAAGAPIAAMTHLVGHALYKAARFLGAGDAIRLARTERRYRPAGHLPAVTPVPVAAAASAGAALFILVTAGELGVLHGADGWLVGTAAASTAAHGAWVWLARPAARLLASVAIGGTALALLGLGYLAIVRGLDRFLAPALTTGQTGFVDPRPALLALVLAFAGGAVLLRRPGARRRLYATAVARGRAPDPRVRVAAAHTPVVAYQVSLPVLRSAA